MQAIIVRTRVKTFFSFCSTAINKIFCFAVRLLYVILPNSLQAVYWAFRTVIKLFILFFGLMILLIGPRIGLPRSIQQATWSLLIRAGCVTTDDIVRLGRGATESTDENAGPVMVAGQLVRLGIRNLDVTAVTSIVGCTVQGVVSEMFWSMVDVLGLKHYFQNVVRHKERLAHHQPPPQYDDDSSTTSTVEPDPDDKQGERLAVVLHKLERSSEWGLSCANALWSQTLEARSRRREQREQEKHRRRLLTAQARVAETEQALLAAEAAAAFAMKLAAGAEAEAAARTAALRRAEAAYEAALATPAGSPAAPPGAGPAAASGGLLGWLFGGPAAATGGDGLAAAEEGLGEANWAAVEALREREERTRQRVEAVAALSHAEAAHVAALDGLARLCPPPSHAPLGRGHVESSVGRAEDAGAAVTIEDVVEEDGDAD